jgi:hypothetical protein
MFKEYKSNLKFLREQKQSYVTIFELHGYSAIGLRIKYKFSDTEDFYERIFLDFEKVLKHQNLTIDRIKKSMARNLRMNMYGE